LVFWNLGFLVANKTTDSMAFINPLQNITASIHIFQTHGLRGDAKHGG
jgi:hypothetical protein